MEIDHLREFVVFAETLNYSIAAKRLFIAQPTLSQHIRRMEQELGFELVTRGPTPALTDEGNQFHVRIQRLIHDYDDIVSSCSASASSLEQPVRVLYFPDFPSINSLIESKRNALSRPTEFPTHEIRQVGDYAALQKYTEFELLDNGLADIAFNFSAQADAPDIPSETESSDYQFTHIGVVKCLLCMPAEHPLARFETLAEAPSNPWPLIEDGSPLMASSVRAISQVLVMQGFPVVNVKARGDSVFDSLRFGNDYLCAFFETAQNSLEAAASKHGFVIKDFPDMPILIHCFAICRKDNSNPGVPQTMKALNSAN